jgi:hypothetical protein
VLKRIFEPKIDEMIRKWRRLQNEDHYCLNPSPNIIRVINSRRIRWEGYVAKWETGKVHTGFWWGNLMERDQLEHPGADGRIILTWIFSKWNGEARAGLLSLRIRAGDVR